MNKFLIMLDSVQLEIKDWLWTHEWYWSLHNWWKAIRLWQKTKNSIEDNGSFWCWLWGHPLDTSLHCARCGMPGNWPTPDAPFLLDRLGRWWRSRPAVYLRHFRQWFSRHVLGWCDVCGGLACVFGRAVGQHWNCDELPF